MNDSSPSSDDRLRALEQRVAELEREVKNQRAAAGRYPQRPRPRRPPHQKRERRTILPKVNITPEDLLKWAGIGLVLVAMALLFKYAVDEGWLTPLVRVVIGLAVGVVLIGLGWRMHAGRPGYARVLQGGGVATFYITLFAAFHVLDLVSYVTAFAGMTAATVVALALAIVQAAPGLAVFGLLGGLATPFMLYTGESDIAALVSYACLLLTATTIIYFWKGWRAMLYATVVGGWAIFLIATGELGSPDVGVFADHLAVQLSAVFGLIAFWVVPVGRSVLLGRDDDPVSWLEKPTPESTGVLARLEWLFRNAVHVLIIVTPLVASALTQEAWDFSERTTGIVMIGLAALFAGAAAYLASVDRDRLAHTHWLAVGTLFTVGLILMLEGDALIVGLAMEVLVLHVLAARLNDRWPLIGSFILSIVVFFWMWDRLAFPAKPPAVVNLRALSDLVVLSIGFATSFAIRHRGTGLVYRSASYVGLLFWLSRELSSFENGQAYVTASWTVCGVILLVVGLTRQDHQIRIGGLATLGIVVAKLFLVDLDELDPLWRIVAFMGVGAGFLLLGWFVPSLWKPMGGSDGEATHPGAQAAATENQEGRTGRQDGP